MKDLSLLHIALIYLAVINVVTFFMYGIDKWKAKRSKLTPFHHLRMIALHKGRQIDN